MRFDRFLILILAGMLMFRCSMGHAQCTWRNGVQVCESPQQFSGASQIYEDELAADPSIVAVEFISETVSTPVQYQSVTYQHATTHSAPRERRKPVRRLLRGIVKAPVVLARAGAQRVRKGVARRSGRRAARASGRYNAVRGCR